MKKIFASILVILSAAPGWRTCLPARCFHESLAQSARIFTPSSFAAVFDSPGRGHRDQQRGSQTGAKVRKHRAAPSGARITVAPWQLGRLRAPLAAARPAFRTVNGM